MNDTGVIRRIDWRELFPWLMLLRVFRVALAPATLLLATLGLAICSAGWWTSGAMFLPKEEFRRVGAPYLTGAPLVPLKRRATWIPPAAQEYLPSQTERVLLPFDNLTAPAVQLFNDQTTLPHVAYYLFGLLISVAVWGFVGGVITRQAVVELGCEQSYDWLDAARFVARRYLQYVLAPLAPLMALALLGLLVVPLGWLMNWPTGVFLAGLVWVFVLGLGLVASWLIVGVLFGWPLMFGAIGTKRDGDALQAFSDSYSYVYGKPLHYFFYAVVAVSLGVLGLTVVQIFAGLTIDFGFWAASWGAGAEPIKEVRQQLAAAEMGQDVSLLKEKTGNAWLISVAIGLVYTVAHAAAYSYFFVASAAIFLLMRLAVDDKEMDEVHLEADEEHLEAARQAMLSDEIPPEKPAPVLPPEPEPERPIETRVDSVPSDDPPATIAFDTATQLPLPPEVVDTDNDQPAAPPTEKPADQKPADN